MNRRDECPGAWGTSPDIFRVSEKTEYLNLRMLPAYEAAACYSCHHPVDAVVRGGLETWKCKRRIVGTPPRTVGVLTANSGYSNRNKTHNVSRNGRGDTVRDRLQL